MQNIQSNLNKVGFSYLPVQLDEYIKNHVAGRWQQISNQLDLKSLSGSSYDKTKENILQQIADEVKIITEAVEDNPVKFYCPTGDNEKLIRNFAHSLDYGDEVVYTSCFSANGVGKTVSSVNICLNLMRGIQNHWFDYPIFRNFPFKSKSIYYCSESSALDTGNVIHSTFEHYLRDLPEGSYHFGKTGKKISTLSIKGSPWRLMFRSYGQTAKQYESENVSVIVCDEPPPDNIWRAIKGRSRDGLIILLNFTPIYCPAYVMEEIEKKIKDGKKSVTKVVSSLWGTTKEQGIRGFRTMKQATEVANNYTIDERESRTDGTTQHYFGRIYKEYDESKHDYPIDIDGLFDGSNRLNLSAENDFSRYRDGVRPWYMPDDRAIYVMSNDPADGRPDAVTYAAINPNSRYILMSGYPIITDRYLWEMKGRVPEDSLFYDLEFLEQELGILLGFKSGIIPISRRIIDKRFSTQTRGGGENMFARYKNIAKERKMSGQWVESYIGGGNKEGEIAFGHDTVRKLMTTYLPDGHPQLVIWNWERTYHIRTGLANYVYRMALKAGQPYGKTIEQKFKDMADAIRFLVNDKSNKDRMRKPERDDNIANTQTQHVKNFATLV